MGRKIDLEDFMKKIVIMSIASIASILLAGCASMSTKGFVPMEKPFEELQLNPRVDLSEVRLDARRHQVLDANKDAEGVVTSKMEDVAYSPLAFDLGNGLCLDVAGNLYFDPATVFDAKGIRSSENPWYSYSREGDKVYNKARKLLGRDYNYVIEGSAVYPLKGNGEKGKLFIEQGDRVITQYSYALLGQRLTATLSTIAEGSHYVYEPETVLGATMTFKKEGSAIAMYRNRKSTPLLRISPVGNALVIEVNGREYGKIERNEQTIMLHSRKNYGVSLQKDGDTIRYRSVSAPSFWAWSLGGDQKKYILKLL